MTYYDQLNRIAQRYAAEHPGESLPIGDSGPDGNLTAEGARFLHYSLCHHAGLPDNQVAAEWNRRSPEDPWTNAGLAA